MTTADHETSQDGAGPPLPGRRAVTALGATGLGTVAAVASGLAVPAAARATAAAPVSPTAPGLETVAANGALTRTTAESRARIAGYTPRAYPGTKVLDSYSRLIIDRFTGGWTPSLGGEIALAGGIKRWFATQLSPSAVSDSFYVGSLQWWPSNYASTATIVARNESGEESIWAINENYQRWSMVRRIHSRRQVLETVTNFWEHHFHVPAVGDPEGIFRAHYGRRIRSLALGRFDALLKMVITHPAMGTYLGNAESTKDAPNENLGRELLELHTVGRDAGYTEDDVKNAARILTGYRVDLWDTWNDYYDPDSHWTGPVSVMGFSHPNSNPDGRAVCTALLSYLAMHPATARRVARKLATHFIGDDPPSNVVEHLARVYLANNTTIAPVLRALIAHPSFKASLNQKVRTPEEDVIATYRALGVRVTRPISDDAAAQAMIWQAQQVGARPFDWPRPDGRPDQASAWTSASRMLGSFSMHYSMSGSWWPNKNVVYRKPAAWLPVSRIRFDSLVDHLSRSIHGRPSTSTLLQAACQATGLSPTTVITPTHPLIQWEMPRLLTVFLDHPDHMTR